MFFVPVVPHHPPPSPRTRELADLLGRVIQEYEQHHPAVTGSEVRAAARLAAQRSSKRGGVDERVAAVVAALVALLGVFVYVAAGSRGGESVPMVAVAIAVFLIFGLVVVLKRMGD